MLPIAYIAAPAQVAFTRALAWQVAAESEQTAQDTEEDVGHAEEAAEDLEDAVERSPATPCCVTAARCQVAQGRRGNGGWGRHAHSRGVDLGGPGGLVGLNGWPLPAGNGIAASYHFENLSACSIHQYVDDDGVMQSLIDWAILNMKGASSIIGKRVANRNTLMQDPHLNLTLTLTLTPTITLTLTLTVTLTNPSPNQP